MSFWRGAPLVAGALLSGCFGPSPEEQAEAGRISRAVDTLRDAANAEKPPALHALEALSCAVPTLCRFRATCVAAYEQYVSGLDAKERARVLLTTGGSAAEVQALLGRAESDLASAKPGLSRCTDAQGEVRRRYRF